MKKHRISRDEVKVHLLEQFDFLGSSCTAYDNGYFVEAKRIAHLIRLLSHETKSSRSLIKQAGLNHSSFLSSEFRHDPTSVNYLISTHLISSRITANLGQIEGSYEPLFDTLRLPKTF